MDGHISQRLVVEWIAGAMSFLLKLLPCMSVSLKSDSSAWVFVRILLVCVYFSDTAFYVPFIEPNSVLDGHCL